MNRVETHHDLSSIAAAWDALADRAGASPFLRPGWVSAWLDAFGGSAVVVAIRRGEDLAALVPLIEHRGAVRSPTNYHTGEFGLLAEDESAAYELSAAIFAQRPRSVSLQFVEPNSPNSRAWLAAAASVGYASHARVLETSPYVAGSSWSDDGARIPGKLRRELRRRRRRLGDEGEVTVEVLDGRERLAELLAEGFRVEAAGWKGRAGSAMASRMDTRRFYTQVASWAAERGWLRLAFLRLDGRPIAFELGIELIGIRYRLRGGYDEAFRRFGPGKLLLHACLERSFAEGVARYELLGTDEPYKMEWTRTTRPLALVQVFSPTVAGRIERVAYEQGRPLAKRTLAAVAGARRAIAKR